MNLNKNSDSPFGQKNSDNDLIVIGISYLSRNIKYRDKYLDEKGKPYSQAPAVEYANAQIRVVRRVMEFITDQPKNLQWLHDYLLKAELDKETFIQFFKIWSKEYSKQHPYKLSKPKFQRNPTYPSMYIQCYRNEDWIKIALYEMRG